MEFAKSVVRPAALTVGLALSAAALAQSFERPPSYAAAKIPGIKPAGENYTIKDPVRSDGLLRLYNVETPYGTLNVHGDQMMRMRANELLALQELEKISGSETFAKALAEAGI